MKKDFINKSAAGSKVYDTGFEDRVNKVLEENKCGVL